ncbi:SDR family oxidoreductase [Nocardia sp. NPDC023852]|uniref:SDR family oxidoreductase n=1 Tax=Nocardia sp. NPDC023852 TaxID=3154697 RepID=UPI0033F39BB1
MARRLCRPRLAVAGVSLRRPYNLDQQAVDKHADAVAATAGSIDIALNAASVLHDQRTLLADLSLEEFMRPIDGFLRTLFITSKAVAPHMGRERPGVILTLSELGSKLATDEPPTGRYRLSTSGLPSGGMRISRADLAEVMVARATAPGRARTVYSVSY